MSELTRRRKSKQVTLLSFSSLLVSCVDMRLLACLVPFSVRRSLAVRVVQSASIPPMAWSILLFSFKVLWSRADQTSKEGLFSGQLFWLFDCNQMAHFFK